MSKNKQPILVRPGKTIDLHDFAADDTGGLKRSEAEAETEEKVKALGELAYRFNAENKRSLLIVLQGMDTSGKDGVVRKVVDGINPLSCRVVSFKQPSAEELDHDFLWRIHRDVPRKGEIGIFNRSHYEDVLVVRVHNLVPEKDWSSRYEKINHFERLLVEGGMTILKFFLHISKEEQRERLQERVDNPDRRWKFSLGDLAERKLWDRYQEAYCDALTKCNTVHAPWHIVPADKKWYRNYVISRVIFKTLTELDPKFPAAQEGIAGLQVE